eukprot:CAMPEP_0202912044 /NCGR_PEP_ID=MMETSP1392-20130828/56674_1 /ASSEMBLY_ACC=CAM_ASM_000868 /TAXON_ID=225041 /ORGANISM="Chlamydomonas chlamydogama, Strain SAG 11-48b" /LENGTH=69 /DNA_ID=CAMNT_0049602805 /DNA_START=1 /DNA_END=213 /DNA_ORIENTATION=+
MMPGRVRTWGSVKVNEGQPQPQPQPAASKRSTSMAHTAPGSSTGQVDFPRSPIQALQGSTKIQFAEESY